jgi:hypothetical protein
MRLAYLLGKAFNTEGTENIESKKRNLMRKKAAFLLFSVPLCVLCGETL